MSSESSPLSRIKKFQVNILYFSLLFASIFVIHLVHLSLIETGHSLFCLFFYFATLLQAIIEAAALTWLTQLAKERLRWAEPICVLFAFVIILLHAFDFFLTRLADLSAWDALFIILQEKWVNFVELLLAAHVSLIMWLFGGVILLSIGILAIGIYYLLRRFSKKFPIKITHQFCIRGFTCLLATLFVLDFSFSVMSPPSIYLDFQKALPWKGTLFQHQPSVFIVNHPLKPPFNEKSVIASLQDIPSEPIQERPNIFLFVIESLRDDFITPSIAPHLSLFKENNTSFQQAFACGNATQLGWFSLFFSKHSLYWNLMRQSSWQVGSVPLNLLKKIGYDIRVYASSRLDYFNMDQLLFGPQKNLTSSFNSYTGKESQPAWQSDRQAIDALVCDMQNPQMKEGQLFIIFLEATHFDYSWPQEMAVPFQDSTSKINYFKASVVKKEILGIKNRYCNALYYIDSLVGHFLHQLQACGLADDAVVAFMGDHGEEFGEEGLLFHGSHLSQQQLNIPLYFSFPKAAQKKLEVSTGRVCHLDVFPSFFDYLGRLPMLSPYVEGHSIFQPRQNETMLASRFNLCQCPKEFLLDNGSYQLLVRFAQDTKRVDCKKLLLLQAKDQEDNLIPLTSEFVTEQFGPSLKELFQY